jgi:hypothetical protein
MHRVALQPPKPNARPRRFLMQNVVPQGLTAPSQFGPYMGPGKLSFSCRPVHGDRAIEPHFAKLTRYDPAGGVSSTSHVPFHIGGSMLPLCLSLGYAEGEAFRETCRSVRYVRVSARRHRSFLG